MPGVHAPQASLPATRSRAPERSHGPRSSAAAGRRRRALLQLAARHGEVRLSVCDRAGAIGGAADVSELLDALNEDGLLRFGGLRRDGDRAELIYLPA